VEKAEEGRRGRTTTTRRGEAEHTSDLTSADVLGELQEGALSVGRSTSLREGNRDDVLGVLNGDKDAGGELELLPGLAEVNEVDA